MKIKPVTSKICKKFNSKNVVWDITRRRREETIPYTNRGCQESDNIIELKTHGSKSKRKAKETVTKGFKANTDITLLNPGRQDIKERQIEKITS